MLTMFVLSNTASIWNGTRLIGECVQTLYCIHLLVCCCTLSLCAYFLPVRSVRVDLPFWTHAMTFPSSLDCKAEVVKVSSLEAPCRDLLRTCALLDGTVVVQSLVGI